MSDQRIKPIDIGYGNYVRDENHGMAMDLKDAVKKSALNIEQKERLLRGEMAIHRLLPNQKKIMPKDFRQMNLQKRAYKGVYTEVHKGAYHG